VVLVLGALVWVAATLVPEKYALLSQTPAQAAVASVVARAILARQNTGIARVRDASGAVPAIERAAMRAEVRRVADELLTGAYRDAWVQSMDEVIDLDGADGVFFTGGADGFSGWHMEVRGDQARVQVRARIFLEMAQSAFGHRTTASNVVDFDLWLSKLDGLWRVGILDWNWAPGGSP
jgi:hypothetical protein